MVLIKPMNVLRIICISSLLIVLFTLTATECSKKSAGVENGTQNTISTAGIFFDDFIYDNKSDPQLTAFGWTVRSGSGGPGPAEGIWDNSLVTFIADTLKTGNRLMKLSSWTQGSGSTCHQSEIYSLVKFQQATFAARVMFTDDTEMGLGGDGIVQTFFTIADWELAHTDSYCEFDFEYLPNGGWGGTDAALWETSWANVENHTSIRQRASHAGTWQILVIQADTLETNYYVNSELRAHHQKPFVVDGLMSINFNHWFIEEQLRSNNRINRRYSYLVDWVFARTDSILSPEAIENHVSELQLKGYPRFDTIK